MKRPGAYVPVTVRGKTYPNAEACAKALGVSVNTVYAALHRGRPDTIGIGKGRGVQMNRGGHKRKPIEIGGVRFPSSRACDRALGFSPGYTQKAIKRGTTDLVVARAMRWKREQEVAAERKRLAEEQSQLVKEGLAQRAK